MSKLDGNERWKSKMLLTEHQEQHAARGDKRQGNATAEEIALIRDAVLLPHVLTMAQKSLGEIERSKITLHQTMAQFMIVMTGTISAKSSAIRRELQKRNIRILTEETNDDIMYYRYVCRGYEEVFGMTREVARTEISRHISRIMAGILNPKDRYSHSGVSKSGEDART